MAWISSTEEFWETRRRSSAIRILLLMVVPTMPMQAPRIEPSTDQYFVFSACARSFSCEDRTAGFLTFFIGLDLFFRTRPALERFEKCSLSPFS